MLDIELNFPDAAPRMSLPSPVLVGRAAPCGLRIAHWRVARRHAWLRAVETACCWKTWIRCREPCSTAPEWSVWRPCCQRTISSSGHAACGCRVARSLTCKCLWPRRQGRIRRAPLPRETDILLESAFASRLAHRRRLHAALLEALDLRRRDLAGVSDSALRAEAGVC